MSAPSRTASLRPQTSAYGLLDAPFDTTTTSSSSSTTTTLVTSLPNPPLAAHAPKRAASPHLTPPNTGKRRLSTAANGGASRRKAEKLRGDQSWITKRSFVRKPVELDAPTDDALLQLSTMIKNGDWRLIQMVPQLSRLNDLVGEMLVQTAQMVSPRPPTDDEGDE